MKISGEQFQKHFKEINEFLENQNYIKDLYEIKGLETKVSTQKLLVDNLIEPFKLNAAIIQYLVFSSADKKGAKTKDHHYSMMLIAAYVQGLFTSYDLYSEGSYIKAAAVLKQDFEIMLRLNEIYKKRHKDGKTPNVQNGPKESGRIYGYLNDVAHIAKQDILDQLMTYTNDEKSGFSPVKKINEKYLFDLFLFDTSIKCEVLRQTLILHFELFGEDEVYERALTYYNVLIDIYSQTGIVKNPEDEERVVVVKLPTK